MIVFVKLLDRIEYWFKITKTNNQIKNSKMLSMIKFNKF